MTWRFSSVLSQVRHAFFMCTFLFSFFAKATARCEFDSSRQPWRVFEAVHADA